MSSPMSELSQKTLADLRQDAADLYRNRGLQHKIGFGQKPAMVVIDFALGWTDPKFPMGSDLDAEVGVTQELLQLARPKGIPVIFTTMSYDVKAKEGNLYFRKLPAIQQFVDNPEASQIDPRLEPGETDLIIDKKWLSAFHGTNLISYLVSHGVDTLILTGCSTSACVRATATDALGHGFIPIVVREAVGDRAKGPHEWNLFDIDAKLGDVVGKAEVIDYLSKLDG